MELDMLDTIGIKIGSPTAFVPGMRARPEM